MVQPLTPLSTCREQGTRGLENTQADGNRVLSASVLVRPLIQNGWSCCPYTKTPEVKGLVSYTFR